MNPNYLPDREFDEEDRRALLAVIADVTALFQSQWRRALCLHRRIYRLRDRFRARPLQRCCGALD